MFLNSLSASYFDRITIGDDKYYAYEDVWTEYATKLLTSVFLYSAIAVIAILLAVGIVVKLKKPQAFGAFLKTAATIILTFAGAIIIVMLALGFGKISEKGYAEDKLLELIPPLVLGAVAVVGIVATYIASLFSQKAYKIAFKVTLALIGAALIATFVCLTYYFYAQIKDDGYYDSPEYGQLNQLGLYVSAGAFIVVTVVAAFVLDRKNKTPFDSKCIALAGVTIALSFALSYIKFFEMPQGGSITLASMLPVMLFAYVYGPKKGLLVGLIYGALQAMQDAYLVHPAQFLLDYPIAFSMIAFTGVFANVKGLEKLPQIKFALGAVIVGALRFLAHLLSGVFAFGAYAIDVGQSNFWLYSAGYNSFVFVDLILVVVVGVILFSSKNFNKSLERYTANKTKQPAELNRVS